MITVPNETIFFNVQKPLNKLIPKLFADFNNTDAQGRLRLSTHGSLTDISVTHVKMEEGIELQLDDGEGLSTIGIAHFSEEEKIWVAIIDWTSFRS